MIESPSKSLLAWIAVAGCALTASSAFAQWSHNPAVNLAIRVTTGDQGVPKIAATPDGGCYIAWGDGTNNGWDTRLQRLNAKGVPQWANGGIIIADTTFSSTEDYGLAVDGKGNAVLAYRDNSSGTTHCEVQKVAPDGSFLWNPAGVQVSTAAASGVKVAVLSDGGVAAAWSQNNGVRVQKLDASGNILWDAGGVVETPTTSFFLTADLQAGDNGGVIVSWVKFTQRHLWAQKYDATGARQWNSGNPLIVFDGTALANGYQPTFLPDGSGGAIFGWYDLAAAGPGNVRVQHVSSAGVELFGHNGDVASTATAGIGRSNPSISVDATTGDIYALWVDVTLPVQSQWGVSAQKWNASGVRQWTDGAKNLVAFSAQQPSFTRVLALPAGGAMGFWFDRPGATAQVVATRLDAGGAQTLVPTIVMAGTAAGSKGRLAATLNAAGNRSLLTWIDGRTDAGDIYAQNVNLDGSLGNPGDVNDDGQVNIDDLLSVIGAWGDCPAPPTFCPADVTPAPTGNGVINIDDLLTVISNWG